LIGILEASSEKKYLVAVDMFSLLLFNHIFCEGTNEKILIVAPRSFRFEEENFLSI